MEFKKLHSSEGNVWKYIFEWEDAIAEAVLYRYDSFDKRTVMCISTQSGCPVGCQFCGTGEKFIRNLTHKEIFEQVASIVKDNDINTSGIEKFQIMFMSMGEPMLNFDNVSRAISNLNLHYPNAELLLSTIGVKNDLTLNKMLEISTVYDKVGLQFSIHSALDDSRDDLIPFKNKLSLRNIRDYGMLWSQRTGRKVYLNYCVGEYVSNIEIDRLKDLFSPLYFAFTFSVICSSDENMKEVSYTNMEVIERISKEFIKEGYNTRVFDPAGQDDIGGGCGQLWHVQEWMKNHEINKV